MYKALIVILTVVVSVVVPATTTQVRAEEKVNGFSKMVGSFNSSIKSGFSKVTKSISPQPATPSPSDATSLQVKAKPSAKLYISAANMHAANDNLQEAEEMYKKALKVSPQNADAMSGFAMLKNKMGSYPEAVVMYEKAAKAHPQNAAVFNGLGLCHATHGDLDRALAALEEAVKLQPRELKYRNNIAMVLVEMGRYDQAFAHFRSQYHDNSVAHYNLAYLIQKRGDKSNAVKHFAAAIKSNPNLSEARVWYNHLAGTQQPRQPQQPQQVAAGPSVVGPSMENPVLATRQSPYHVESSQPPVNRPRVWLPRQAGAAPRHQSMVQREATAKEQLDALGSASAPIQSLSPTATGKIDPQSMAFRSRPGNTAAANTTSNTRQSSMQRLPPIEQSFERTTTPSSRQAEKLQLTAPQAPTPQTPVRAGTQFNRPVYEHPTQPSNPAQFDQAAPPMPGPIVPSSPPASGTTRAPVVYPLPPVNGYQY
ncbi:MAG: tetratricopeptide repeat protein [Planctomycetota bacterium]|nr:tetratricopeptide repeat protein [Planctomycetota bacterium]